MLWVSCKLAVGCYLYYICMIWWVYIECAFVGVCCVFLLDIWTVLDYGWGPSRRCVLSR